MAYSAYLLNTNATKQPVHQVAHGFDAGDLVVWDGTEYIFSLSDSPTNCEGTVIVSDINGANDFWVAHIGQVGPLDAVSTPFVSGSLYYVSSTQPGRLTTVAPTTPGMQLFPCFVATSTDSGIFFGGFGTTIEGDAERTSIITASQTLASGYRYFVNGGAPLALPLPTNPVVGDVIQLDTINANGYVITFVGGQTVVTAAGTFATSITSTTIGDALKLVCRTAGAASVWFVEDVNTGSIAFA